MATKSEKYINRNVGQEIYVIKHPERFVKIGRSVDPKRRLKEIQKNNPSAVLELVETFDVSGGFNPALVENHVHEEFSDSHAISEWFTVSVDDAVSRVGESIAEYESNNDPEAQFDGEDSPDQPEKNDGSKYHKTTPAEIFKTISALQGAETVVYRTKVANLNPSWSPGRVSKCIEIFHKEGVIRSSVGMSDGGKTVECFEINPEFLSVAGEAVEWGLFDSLDGVVEAKMEGYDV